MRAKLHALTMSRSNGFLQQRDFESAVVCFPLVSVDWILISPARELLVGQRINSPARGAWFTPGGRIRKSEPVHAALMRVAEHELGCPEPLATALARRARLMGAWDHLYPDSAFSDKVPTHYVNLPHHVALTGEEISELNLPTGEQHAEWAWMSLPEALTEVHPYVKPYVSWLNQHL